MPKMKTKSGAKKRFKVTATGRVVAAQAGKRHGPDDAVRHHLGSGDMSDSLHEEGQEAPEQIGREGEGKATRRIAALGAAGGICVGHGVVSRRFFGFSDVLLQCRRMYQFIPVKGR